MGCANLPPAPQDRPVDYAALLLWEEHCVECAVPECYTLCKLYVPRRDKKCARFTYGIYPNPFTAGLFPYGADVRFRRWGKLETFWTSPPRMVPPRIARRYATCDRLLSDATRAITPRPHVNDWHYRLRHHIVYRLSRGRWTEPTRPEALYLKFFSPDELSDELVVEGYRRDLLILRNSIPFRQGWTERAISLRGIPIDSPLAMRILVRPANDREVRLVFTWLDLVRFAPRDAENLPELGAATREPAAKVKCVVWDLDGTLWDGVIGDDGPRGIRPREDAVKMVRKLDERGILQSIASKNDFQLAWRKIEELGLKDFFLLPAIGWGRKSDSIRAIADGLNIGADTFALIDDDPRERAEVQAALPQVRAYDASGVGSLLALPEFTVPVTQAAPIRRLSYLAEAQRNLVAAGWSADYDAFLRSCAITMRIVTPSNEQKSRCLELINRSNQLNLAARRYADAEFDRLLENPNFECFVLECSDRFGDYGLVGFAAVHISGAVPTLVDFVLSCRVARKRVEEAFFGWYAWRAQRVGARRLRALFVPTARNGPIADVLSSLEFETVGTDAGARVLERSLDREVNHHDVVRVQDSP